MNRMMLRFLLSVIAVLFTVSYETAAQSQSAPGTVQSSSEQSLQELVAEVRQLRSEVRRLSSAVFKGQITIERYRVQQADVARLSHELNDVRAQLDDLQAREEKVKVSIKYVERDVETGVRNEREMRELKADLNAINQIEQRLIQRQAELANELNEARVKLSDLEKQLNALER